MFGRQLIRSPTMNGIQVEEVERTMESGAKI